MNTNGSIRANNKKKVLQIVNYWSWSNVYDWLYNQNV